MSEPLSPKQKTAAAAVLVAAIAAPLEGLRQVAYQDPPGIWTVCYGDTHDVSQTKVYTLAECKSRLDMQTVKAVEAVEKCHPSLPMNVLVAMSDAAYNLGPRVACDASYSSVARSLYAGEYNNACRNLLKFDKARVAGVLITLPGLSKRRKIESTLCLS